ncbi:MAG: polymer-forming cytoskeletal protein, partial [Raoultibacter sp.]
MQSASVSSKVLKVLLALILAIGLMPAIQTQQAFAAGETLTINGFAIADNTSADDDSWEFDGSVLIVRGAIEGPVVSTEDITVKSTNDAASITAEGETALNVTGNLTIDTVKGALAVSTTAGTETAATPAVVASGTGTFKTTAGTSAAPAKAFIANTELVTEENPEAISVAGAATVAADSTVIGNLLGDDTVTVAGTLAGDVNAVGKLTVAAKSSLTGNVIAADDVEVNGALNGNVDVTGTYTLAAGGTATGNVVAGGAVTIDGAQKGNISSDLTVVVSAAGAGTVDGSILKATTVTLGSAGNSAAVTGNIGALADGVATVSGLVTVGVDASLNPLDGKSSVAGNIVTADSIVLNGTADLQGTAAIKSGETVTVAKFAAVKDSALTLDYGATIVNDSTANVVVALIGGGTKTVAAGTDFTNSDFTVEIDATKFPTYDATEITNLETAFGSALVVLDSTGTETSSYQLTLVPATEGQKVLEAGSYILKVENDGGSINGSLDIEVSVNKAKLTDAIVSDIEPVQWTGKEVTPEVEVLIGSDVVDPANYSVKYSNNVNLGTATATITFGAASSVEAGTLTKQFQIAADPAKSLAGATIALKSSGTLTFTGADLQNTVVTGVTLSSAPVASSNYDLTFYDESGKKVDTVIKPGRYKVAISAKAGSGFTDSKTAEFVVNADYNVTGWSLKLSGLNDVVYTGATASTTASSGRLMFQNENTYFTYTVKGSALGVDSSAINAGTAAIAGVVITDPSSTYLNGNVKTTSVTEKSFQIAPLNLSTAELAFGTLNSEGTVDVAVAVFNGADQASTLAGKGLYVKTAGAWQQVNAAGFTKAVNPDETGVQGATKDVDNYSVLVKAKDSQKNIVGSKTIADTAVITPADLKGKSFTATDATYNTLAQLPTDAWQASGISQDLELGKDFTMTAVDAKGNPITATNAGDYKVKVSGVGNYMGTANLVDFTIGKLDLSDASVTSNADGLKLPYNQKAQTPLTELYVGTLDSEGNTVKHVIPTSNYAVSYAANTAIGSATATVAPVKDNKNLDNTKSVSFGIVATTDLAVASVTLDNTSFTYDGKDHLGKITSVVAADGKTLVKDQDYTVAGAGLTAAKAVNTYTITLTGKGAYSGTQNVTWSIEAASIETAALSGVENIKWDGVKTIASSAPTKVMLGETTLVSGTDYETTFTYEKFNTTTEKWEAATSTDKAVGLYRVTVTGKGNYAGSTCMKEFRVTGISLSMLTFTLNTGETYTGSPVTVTVTVTPVSGPFSKLTVADYAAVAYYDSACSNPVVDDNGDAVNPTDAGTYYVRIEAKDSGNATGASLAVPFKVAPKDIAPDTDTKTMTYNGEDQSPLIVKDGALELEENVDYTVVYKNTKSATVKPRNVATYSAEITAVADGNYTFRSGTSVADVEITPLEVVIDKNVYSVDPQVATGEQITPDVPNALDVTADVINAAGESVEKTFMLKKTTDYTVTYGANTAIAADGGSVIFTEVANSNFTINSNPASVKFDIAAINDLAVAKVSAVDPQTFTGKPLRPAVSVVAADGKMLVENIDYALSYINNIEVGIAAVIVKGMGSYVGSTDVSFRIVSG